MRHRNGSPSAKSARQSYSLRCRFFVPTCPLTGLTQSLPTRADVAQRVKQRRNRSRTMPPLCGLISLRRIGVSSRFVSFCTAIWTDQEHTSDQRPSLSIFRERILHQRGLTTFAGQARPTPYEKLTPRRRSLYVQSTVQKITDLELTSDMKLHRLPWPREQLAGLGAAPVELRATLSYFVEPNPGERGWTRRHRCASHGLRFRVKSATESLNEFRARINM
jgi:hypothetical protein